MKKDKPDEQDQFKLPSNEVKSKALSESSNPFNNFVYQTDMNPHVDKYARYRTLKFEWIHNYGEAIKQLMTGNFRIFELSLEATYLAPQGAILLELVEIEYLHIWKHLKTRKGAEQHVVDRFWGSYDPTFVKFEDGGLTPEGMFLPLAEFEKLECKYYLR